jgi:hypothetical protein
MSPAIRRKISRTAGPDARTTAIPLLPAPEARAAIVSDMLSDPGRRACVTRSRKTFHVKQSRLSLPELARVRARDHPCGIRGPRHVREPAITLLRFARLRFARVETLAADATLREQVQATPLRWLDQPTARANLRSWPRRRPLVRCSCCRRSPSSAWSAGACREGTRSHRQCPSG